VDDGGRRGSRERLRHGISIRYIGSERSGALTESSKQMAPDEALGAGDDDRAVHGARP
jgi:hypothetical protein